MFFVYEWNLSNSFLQGMSWPKGAAMLHPRKWSSVLLFPSYNWPQSPDGSNLIHSVLGPVSRDALEFGFGHIEFELTTVYLTENVQKTVPD